VRLELGLEIIQTRSPKRRFQPGGLALSFREGSAHEQQLRGGDDDGITRHVEIRVVDKHRPEGDELRLMREHVQCDACDDAIDDCRGHEQRNMRDDQTEQARRLRAQMPMPCTDSDAEHGP
jgi:hypothetical protein